MKYILLTMILAGFCTVCAGQRSDKKDELPIPKIFVVYTKGGIPFDVACAREMNKPINPADVAEVYNRLSEFQSLWDKDGPLYLRTIMSEVGVSFPYREMQATLTACEFTSLSSPLIIYVKRFLSTAEKPLPSWAFAEILFHEVMHTYVRGVYESSSLRKKYSSENHFVLNHLHTMAIEKMVLMKLDRKKMLQWLDNRYRNLFGPDYKRAWEIVNDMEDYKALIDELKSMPRSGMN